MKETNKDKRLLKTQGTSEQKKRDTAKQINKETWGKFKTEYIVILSY